MIERPVRVPEALTDTHSSTPLIVWPQEILDDILSYVTIADKIIVALTCSYSFRFLAPAWRDAMTKDSAPWAGDRLAYDTMHPAFLLL